MGLLGLMVVLFLVFKGIFILFSIVAVSSYIPTTGQEGSLFSTPSPAFTVCGLFDDGHSGWYEVIPRCSFGCISLIISDVEHLLMWFLAICMSSLKKCPFF